MEITLKKVTIFLPDLSGGGAERVFVSLSKAFVDAGYQVEFVLLKKKGVFLEKLDEGVTVIDFDAKRIRNAFIPLLLYLKANKPDVLIAAMWPLTIVACLAFQFSGLIKSGSRLLLSEHNVLSLSTDSSGFFKKYFLKLTLRYIYPLANERLAVSWGVAEDMKALANLKTMPIKVIYNPIIVEPLSTENDYTLVKKAKFGILNVGTLKHQKDQSTLISAFNLIEDKLDVELFILGEGNLRNDLELKINELDLKEKVHLFGFQEQISRWYFSADLFVLSSRYEGFGNVLVEAMTCGVPVVSTDCPSGPAEILQNGKYGKLVPVGDAHALAEAMLLSLQEKHDSEALKSRAADFSVDKIAQQYINVMFPMDNDSNTGTSRPS